MAEAWNHTWYRFDLWLFKVEYSTHCATGMDIKKLFPLVFILPVTMKFSFTGCLWSIMFEFTAVIDSSSTSTNPSEAWYQSILETSKTTYSSISGHLTCHIKKGLICLDGTWYCKSVLHYVKQFWFYSHLWSNKESIYTICIVGLSIIVSVLETNNVSRKVSLQACSFQEVKCKIVNFAVMIWSPSNFFPSLHYRILWKIQISTIASMWGNWSGNAELVLSLEFGKPAVQSLWCLGKMSYSVNILVLQDVSHSIDLVIILRSHSSLRMETSSVNAICTISVWILYKIGKDKFSCTLHEDI